MMMAAAVSDARPAMGPVSAWRDVLLGHEASQGLPIGQGDVLPADELHEYAEMGQQQQQQQQQQDAEEKEAEGAAALAERNMCIHARTHVCTCACARAHMPHPSAHAAASSPDYALATLDVSAAFLNARVE